MSQTKKLTKSQKFNVDSFSTKSAKIRYLTNLDWTRSEISKYLNILYQHVRNVQITPVKNPTEQKK
ncbi:hypothetical protein LCGC14_0947890 [marine sediment metagenome]|uniref:Uncharacterized protein n=1 Tax=marine sediment metagenome TaxID=412755 RepID=A0A0F9NI90_9ZZZZ